MFVESNTAVVYLHSAKYRWKGESTGSTMERILCCRERVVTVAILDGRIWRRTLRRRKVIGRWGEGQRCMAVTVPERGMSIMVRT